VPDPAQYHPQEDSFAFAAVTAQQAQAAEANTGVDASSGSGSDETDGLEAVEPPAQSQLDEEAAVEESSKNDGKKDGKKDGKVDGEEVKVKGEGKESKVKGEGKEKSKELKDNKEGVGKTSKSAKDAKKAGKAAKDAADLAARNSAFGSAARPHMLAQASAAGFVVVAMVVVGVLLFKARKDSYGQVQQVPSGSYHFNEVSEGTPLVTAVKNSARAMESFHNKQLNA